MLTVKVPATMIRESPKALLVRLIGNGKEIWVPKSVGRIEKVVEVKYHPAHALPAEFRKPEATVLSVPSWFWDKVK